MSKDLGPGVPMGDDPNSKKARREYMRKLREQAAADAQRDRDNLIQGRLEREAQRERDARKSDADWEREMRNILGDDIDDIERDLGKALDKPGVKEALDALHQAQREAKGGFWSSGNPDKAKRTIRRNQNKIRKAHKQAKKGWCSLVLIGLLALPAGAGYGLYELLGWVL